jgi:hypothetical protein
MHPAHGDTFEISLFFLSVPTGTQTGGNLFTANTLPQFADICPVEPDWVRSFLQTGNPLPRPSRLRQLWKRLRAH